MCDSIYLNASLICQISNWGCHPDTAFDAPFVSNMLRMKTSLKYGTRIRLASLFNCILVVASDSIFIVSLAFFFLAATPCLRLYGSRYSPYLYEQDIIHDPVPSCDRDVTLRVDIAQLCCRLPLSPR